MKKKIFFVLLFLISLSQFSQAWKELTFEQHKDASTENKLSQYFTKEISKKLLRKVSFNNKLKYITLSFYVNKHNKPYDIKLNYFVNKELSEKIKAVFKNYPFEELNLENISKNKQYYFQIISKKRRKNIINCSNKIFVRSLPNCNSCSDLEYYEDIKVCIEKKIKKHLTEKIDFSLANRFKTDESFSIDLDLVVDINGNLSFKKVEGSIIFLESIEKAIASFPRFEVAATLNDKKTTWNYKTKYFFNKKHLPSWREKNCKNDSLFKRNSTNDFALYLKTKIKEKDLEKANLNRVFNSLILNFELDKKNIPYNISTNARSHHLNNLIINSFKEYPIEKLKFFDKSIFNHYSTQILSLEKNKIIIKTNELIGNETPPIFPGCENSKSIKDAKKCFAKGVQMHFSRKFNADLPNKLGLSKGRKRVFIRFIINKEGYTDNIIVKAPHPKIKDEVIEVMKRLPKITPAIQSGNKVNINYSIPFSIIVQ